MEMGMRILSLSLYISPIVGLYIRTTGSWTLHARSAILESRRRRTYLRSAMARRHLGFRRRRRRVSVSAACDATSLGRQDRRTSSHARAVDWARANRWAAGSGLADGPAGGQIKDLQTNYNC